jgi:hypothetical protein
MRARQRLRKPERIVRRDHYSRLMLTGVNTSVRFFFAFFGVDDVSPAIR